ncbi:hypothetical protein [Kitasatospora fiedleri]|uniref:hypothetical protein n=1 Tax=Kitasatospora fiedleri TaxID=2991545 RepID=UPI00249CDE3A|nr:hypothetical protein [Kitasatospora fiedleri]
MSDAKDRGTRWESAVRGYLQEAGQPDVRRNVQMGRRDIGDLDGYYLHAVECKDEQKITLSAYVAQANREAINAMQPYGCAIVKRRRANVSAGYVVRDLETDAKLINRLRDAEETLLAIAPTVHADHVQRHGKGH